jgi:hypothetical protein
MLLDIGSVLGGIGLAAVAFLVVILVCVVILRLLAAILPSYEERDAARLAATAEPVAGDVSAPGIEAPVPGTGGADPGAAEADPGPE